jgi:integrase
VRIVPYLARYTLARREEICGLDVEDVLEENDMPFIFIRPNEHRTLKNAQSMRRIPLIGEVQRLGFLRYHAEIKRLGHRLLFPELRAASNRTPLGDVFYGDWIKVQNVAVPNAEEERKTFHSFPDGRWGRSEGRRGFLRVAGGHFGARRQERNRGALRECR